MHGQHVKTLVIQEDVSNNRTSLDIFNAAPALGQLQRLEISEWNCLEQLVPVLRDLPHLQHLAVSLSMEKGRSRQGARGVLGKAKVQSPSTVGYFLVSDKNPKGFVPDMQQLCPRLTSLALRVRSTDGLLGMTMDPGVSRLFSPKLQQLTVADDSNGEDGPVLCVSSLVHLSALQQLTLHGVRLKSESAEAVAQALPALQQLRVLQPRRSLWHGAAVLLPPLTAKLVDFEVCVEKHGISNLTNFVHLTRLVLHGIPPEGTAQALAALTGLQQLGLQGGGDSRAAGVVQQAAGMAQLRSLQLDWCNDEPSALALHVAQCTQLTSLVLLVQDLYQQVAAYPWAPALQQLTGLQCLTVHEQLLGYEQGAWLGPLTQLTSLCVRLDDEALAEQEWDEQSDEAEEGEGDQEEDDLCKVFKEADCRTMLSVRTKAEELVAQLQLQLQPWPTGLQQVMFWVGSRLFHCGSCEPMCWQQAGPSGGQVAVWLEAQGTMAAGWARPLRPCPHLPGVWELQGPAQSRPQYQLV
jgi:hypothetical protein